MSLFETVEDVVSGAAARRLSPIGFCVQREYYGRDDLVHFIPELIRRGYAIDNPGHHVSYPLFYAIRNWCMKSLAVLLECMPAGMPGRSRDERDNTIVHLAAASGRKDLVELALSLCPEGLNYTNLEGETPLMYGSTGEVHRSLNPATRELIHRGCDMNTPCDYTLHRISAPQQIIDYICAHERHDDTLLKYCIAFGARPTGFSYQSYNGSDPNHPEYVLKARSVPTLYLEIINAVEKCRSSAYAILRLARARGNVCGNGRDVLRLIAKEVWLSRLDESWEK